MSWMNVQIAKVFPSFALKREIAIRRIKRLDSLAGTASNKRSFDAVSGSRTRYDFLSTNKSPDAAIAGSIESLREHVRQMEYNSGYVAGPIRRIAKNVVGQGIRFQARLQADKKRPGATIEIPKINKDMADGWNYFAEKQFAVWNKQADKRLLMSFYELQKMAEMALIRDNEVLVIGRTSTRRSRMVPYCLDLFEADRLQTPMSEINNPKIRHGIEYDDEGVPKTYFILKVHPGEMLGVQVSADSSFEDIPAFNPNGTRKVMHLFNPLRPEQSRGFSQFAPGLKDLQDLDRYMEAEKMAALEAACLTGVVTTEDPVGFNQAFTEDGDDPKREERIHEFAPGMWHYLNANEKAEILNPNRPNDQFGAYIDQLIRGPANALDVPPEIISQNWKGFNYSNARTVLLQFWATCTERQAYLINHLCIPVWDNLARILVATGKVPVGAFERRTEDYLRSGWIPNVYRKWVDPVKEAKGKEVSLNNNFETLTDICAETGKDVDEVLETRAREEKKKMELEKEYGVSLTPKPSVPEPAPTKEDEDEDEDKRATLSVV